MRKRALWHSCDLNNRLSKKIVTIEVPESTWYEESHVEGLRTLCMEHGIFVFSADLEGIMQTQKTRKSGKPLRALERVLKLIRKDSIPSEFYEMCKFLTREVSRIAT